VTIYFSRIDESFYSYVKLIDLKQVQTFSSQFLGPLLVLKKNNTTYLVYFQLKIT